MRFTCGKKYRLRSTKTISALFSEGEGFFNFPIRVKYHIIQSDESALRCAFIVPKRIFKRAVDRNRVKRLMREAFRLNKHELMTELYAGKTVEMIWIYADKRILPQSVISKAALQIFKRLIKKENSR